MKRLKLFISIFCLAISLPLAYVIWQTYTGLAQEERGQLSFFGEALLNEIEAELATLVQREEDRAVDEYRHTLVVKNGHVLLSPLAQEMPDNYILGYMQNNPDGTYQTPMVSDIKQPARYQRSLIKHLAFINNVFNRKKFAILKRRPPTEPVVSSDKEEERTRKSKAGFADRYFARAPQKSVKNYLGKKAQRTEEITADQARNISRETQSILEKKELRQPPAPEMAQQADEDSLVEVVGAAAPSQSPTVDSDITPHRFQVEVAPLQSVMISESYVFIFRRIAINNKIYRQGFILKIIPFLRHLAAAHFESQPMAQFSHLNMQVIVNRSHTVTHQSGAPVTSARFTTQRTFPAPFDFMSASIQSDEIPASPARRTLNAALLVLGIFMLLGLFGIYQSARAVVALSERRSQFVSSVTHELKTPLTNIRMYIEMLEQGIAATPDREQDYFQILDSESARLSRLINNVLELAKLEKKQRHFDLQTGNLEEVLLEVRTIMAHTLDEEGFELKIDALNLPPLVFDREVMIQMMINLLENSIKFGRKTAQRQITISAQVVDKQVQIAVADCGPGIPKKALKKVFDDFYRVDNDLTRTTGGTGIGLALVKKFVTAMGGTVDATNNTGPGCTISLRLPLLMHAQ